MIDRDLDRERIRVAANNAIDAAANTAELEAARIKFLGKKGEVSLLYSDLGSMTLEARKLEGAANNALKFEVEERHKHKLALLRADERNRELAAETVDVTLPVRLPGVETGRIHPISQV